MPHILAFAVQAPVVRRAAIIAAIVGVLIGALNHGDKVWAGTMTSTDWMKVILTFFVPYTVSTVSSVLAMRDQLGK